MKKKCKQKHTYICFWRMCSSFCLHMWACTQGHTCRLVPLMPLLACSQHHSVIVPKECVLFRLLLSDREQVQCQERMSDCYDLAGWLPLGGHAVEFSNSYNLRVVCYVALSMKHHCHPSSESDHWALKLECDSGVEAAQVLAWFPAARDAR